jgi:hypothetical protein
MTGDMSADPPGDPDHWVSIRQAARCLGVTRAAVYSRIERGTLQARPHGNRGQLVRLPPDIRPNVQADGGTDTPSDMSPNMPPDMLGQHAALQAERDQLADEVERWRTAHGKAEVENARLAAELAGKVELVEELRRQRDRLEAQLAEARTPLWSRLLAALRARSGP